MNELISRLRDAADQMIHGVYGPAQIAVVMEAADRLNAVRNYIGYLEKELSRDSDDPAGRAWACHWHEDLICRNEQMCDGCGHQPAPEEKKNGRAPPLPLKWSPDYFGGGMGWPVCPACGEMPYSTDRCLFCGQRFVQDEVVEAYNAPAQEVRMDCLVCGGKGTLAGTRAKSNGHFHGVCEACGAHITE